MLSPEGPASDVRLAWFWIFTAWLAAAGHAAPPAAQQLEGLWEVVEVRDLTANRREPRRREFHMYTATHQMIILAGLDRPKIAKSLADMTPEEAMTQQPIGAGFYRYRVDGDRLIRTNLVALSAYYEGKTFETEFEIEGDTLVLRDQHAADGHLREWRLRRVE